MPWAKQTILKSGIYLFRVQVRWFLFVLFCFFSFTENLVFLVSFFHSFFLSFSSIFPFALEEVRMGGERRAEKGKRRREGRRGEERTERKEGWTRVVSQPVQPIIRSIDPSPITHQRTAQMTISMVMKQSRAAFRFFMFLPPS